MHRITQLHLDHLQALFLNERSRREGIRGSLSTPVAAISFAVFAFSSLSVEVNPDRWQQTPTLLIFLLGAVAALALFASAWQVLMAEWLFVHHEPPRLVDLLDEVDGRSALEEEEHVRALLAASYAVAYEQYLKGNAISARRRTWALRLILLSLLLQALAFVILPFHRAGW
ncbi:hypothetical protein [Massilia sp. GCM10023247]|uniref:hypothetical protein n=1 Tax=Massilia sp. GCM10023247 TaxID=3252643 RepID=UPI00360B507D